MSRRQTQRYKDATIPRIWLMSDLRFGADLLPAIRRLPTGSGVVFRHHALPGNARRALFKKVKRICKQRGHYLLLASDERIARRWHADGFHARGKQRRSRTIINSAPVHNWRELAAALRGRPDLLFISPVFETASHPEAQTLGRSGLRRLAEMAGGTKVIALGGMTARKAAGLRVYGWAAIDAFRRRSKPKR